MAAISAGAIAAASALGIGGGIIDSIGQYHANKALSQEAFNQNKWLLSQQQAFNAAQAWITREREDSVYQRTLADMEKAGINPASIGMTPPSSHGGPMASSGLSNMNSSSVGRTDFGHILSNAFQAALTDSLRNDRFAEEIGERTAYHAQQIQAHTYRTDTWHQNSKRVSKEPAWMKDYVKNFDNDIEYL